jgi:hypothetical protein
MHVFVAVALAVTFSFVTAPTTWAGTTWKPKMLIYGGVGLPSGPDSFTDSATLGLGGGIGVGLFVLPALMLQASVDYTTFGVDEEGLRERFARPPDTLVIGGETSTFYASASVRFDLLSLPLVRPYVLGGAGFFRILPDDVQFDNVLVELEPENTVGFHGGVGVDVSLGPLINVFAEAIYVAGLTEDQATSFFPFRAGLVFELGPES